MIERPEEPNLKSGRPDFDKPAPSAPKPIFADSTATRNPWLAMVGIGLGVLMSTIDFSIVNIALPTLVKELHTDLATVQWVILSYSLVVTSLMLSVARLGDLFGRKTIYSAGLLIFSLGSLLCGMAENVACLIAFRAFQALGAVMMQALGAAIVTEIFPSTARGRALGVIGGIVSFGLAVGPALGGLLIGIAGWQSIFLINVPIGVIAGIAVAIYVPASRQSQYAKHFDLAGALILLIALASYSFAMTLGQRAGFANPAVLMMLSLAGAGLVIFFLTEQRIKQPMVDPRMFGNVLLSFNLLMSLLVFISMAGMVVLPFFLESAMGCSTRLTGLLMMSIPLSMGLIAPWAGSLSDRHGPRGISLLGLLVMMGGCLAVTTLHEDVSLTGYILRIAPLGIGLGLFQSPNNSAVLGSVPAERLGVASGLLSLSRNLGVASGLPLLSALFATRVIASPNLQEKSMGISKASPAALLNGLSLTYQAAAGIVLAAVILAALAFWIDKRHPPRI